MMGSGEPKRLSADISDSIHRSTLASFLEKIVNNDDDGDAPIFECSIKDSSNHQVQGTDRLRLGWQGSCQSFADLDCSDHSTGSVRNGYDKPDQRRGNGQAPKSLLDCFVKSSKDLTVFSENDDDSDKYEIHEVNNIKAQSASMPSIPMASKEGIQLPLDCKDFLSGMNDTSHKSSIGVEIMINCTTTIDFVIQQNQQSVIRNEDFLRHHTKCFNKQRNNGLTRARSRTRIASRAKELNASTFVYEPLSGKSLVTDNMESCSSLSFCSLNDDDLMGSTTRIKQHLSDSFQSSYDQEEKGVFSVPKISLQDRSKDTIPRFPSRCPSPTRW